MMSAPLRLRRVVCPLAAALAALSGCGGGAGPSAADAPIEINTKPAFVGAVTTLSYDGSTDDLLTAGLGRAGLAGGTPALSATPTAAELRKLAIFSNYRALVDINANGGYGSLYGPNVSPEGVAGTGDGKIAGTESIAYADDGSGTQNVTMMVQVPARFDPANPCIVTATSSGSRGIYGAIATAGEWGLKRGCAVAYSDKGTGNGLHDLQNHTATRIDGRRGSATALGSASNFTARMTEAERAAFNAATPNRFATKHAHSEQNPEKDWGRHTLQAVEFAFWLLNERYGTALAAGGRARLIKPENTLVIASSVSNGAGAALAAAELDTAGWIDGVAVAEPSIQLAPGGGLTIQRGTRPAYTAGSKPLFDYISYANLLQACAANASTTGAAAPAGFAPGSGSATLAANRCAALASAGLVSGATAQERADDALARLKAYGWEPESDLLHTSHWNFVSPAIAATYANTYSRARVTESLCGFSFAATGSDARPAPPASLAAIDGLFGTGNGVPPTGPLQLIWNSGVGGAINHGLGVSPTTGQADFSFDGANCLRQLWTGTGANATRLKAGVEEVYRTANLRGKPTIIVHGRSDALIPVNFSSRPYVLRNAQVEGTASRMRYIEVTNAQHFDSFLSIAGYDSRFIPLHVYFVRAMDAMWAHLKNGAPLPPSQLVRTTPRGGTAGAAPALTAAQLPPFAAVPGANAISVTPTLMTVPE